MIKVSFRGVLRRPGRAQFRRFKSAHTLLVGAWLLGALGGGGLVLAAPPGQGDLGDWANLGRYRDANTSLGPDAARTVFLGDSITEGWANEAAFRDEPHWVGRGIGGQTAQQMVVRFRQDVVNLKPRVVHLMAGTNDVAGNNGPESDREIQDALASMVDLALANGMRVVLASIPPAADFPWRPGLHPAERIRTLNAGLKDFASRKHLTYVDYGSALATAQGGMKPAYSDDGVHPNARGYEAMTPLARDAAARASKAPRSR